MFVDLLPFSSSLTKYVYCHSPYTFHWNTPTSLKSYNNRIYFIYNKILAKSVIFFAKNVNEIEQIRRKNTFSSYFVNCHHCPLFSNLVFSSFNHHPGLTGSPCMFHPLDSPMTKECITVSRDKICYLKDSLMRSICLYRIL